MAQVVRSELLSAHGFAHGFSTRVGGVSSAPFGPLNFGRVLGDDPAAVAENHARLARAVGYAVERLYETSQVHGVAVRRVGGDESVEAVRSEDADALVSAAPGVAVGVRTADCIPVLVGCLDTGAVAAIHAGWRGVVEGVVPAGVHALLRAGGRPEQLVAAIGPCIRAASFEVGDDVAARIAAAAPGVEVILPRAPRAHVDLPLAVVAQLRALGLAPDHIEDVGHDTFAEPDTFHSHRRDASRSGRHLSVIAVRG
jgi:hypothetical protein